MEREYIHREPLTSDIIFKAVFGQDKPECKAALIELLNLVLEREEDPIVELTYLNPFSIAEAEKEKTVVMDIKVTTDSGELIDIEMQIEQLDTYLDRSVFYGCKQLTKGLERGEDYDRMKKSIVISFIKTKLFPPEVPMHSVFTVRENTMGRQLSGLLELHFIELGKIEWKGRDPEELSPLEQLGAYMRCTGEESEAGFVEALVRKGEKVITMADTVLRKISEEERLQIMEEDKRIAEIFRRMDMAHSRKKALKEGREEGLREGREEGRQEGRQEGREAGLKEGRQEGRTAEKLEIAKNFKRDGIPLETIAKNTGLSIEEVEEL